MAWNRCCTPEVIEESEEDKVAFQHFESFGSGLIDATDPQCKQIFKF